MKRLLFALVLLAGLVALPGAAHAGGLSDDQVIFGGSFVLREGETLDGSLVVFGGTVTLEQGSVVQGDVVLMGGAAEANGTVQGNLVVFGGTLDLGEQAVVMGDVAAVGGVLRRAPGAVVHGQVVEGENIPFSFEVPSRFDFGNWRMPRLSGAFFSLMDVVWFFLQMVIWAALAVVVVVMAAGPVERVARAAMDEPMIAAGAGLLALVLTPIAIVVMAVTLILLPASLALALALGLAWLFGWIALGWEFGRRMAVMLKVDLAPALAAGIGTLVLYLVFAGFARLVPCVGSLPRLAVGMWGLGAVVLTVFGSREYHLSASLLPGSAASSDAPAEADSAEEA